MLNYSCRNLSTQSDSNSIGHGAMAPQPRNCHRVLNKEKPIKTNILGGCCIKILRLLRVSHRENMFYIT